MATNIPKSPLHAHYASPIFKIIAGPEGDEYNVHSGFLAAKSPMLKAIVDGEWKESSERVIRWEEWDSATVAMFVEWVYTAEYSCVFPELVERPELLLSSKIKANETKMTINELSKWSANVEEARENMEIATHPNNAKQLSGPEPEVEAADDDTSEVSASTAKAGSQIRKRYTKELNNALEEQQAANEWIAGLRRIIADIDQNTDHQRSEKTLDDYVSFKRKVTTRRKLSGTAPTSVTAEIEVQKQIHNNLVVPLPQPSFKPKPPGWPQDHEEAVLVPLLGGGSPPAVTSQIKRFTDWVNPTVRGTPHARESIDYTKPFLVHAKMYVLGDYAQIPELRAYAFRALQVVLEATHPIPKHSLAARAFAMLVQYVYTHTADGEPLRELVASIAAWNHRSLLLEQEYLWVLEDGGEFVLDLTELLARRLPV